MGRQRVANRDKQRKRRKLRREGRLKSVDEDTVGHSKLQREPTRKRRRTVDDVQGCNPRAGETLKVEENITTVTIATDSVKPETISDGSGLSPLTRGLDTNDGGTVLGGVFEDADTCRIERMRMKNRQRKEARKAKTIAKRVAAGIEKEST